MVHILMRYLALVIAAISLISCKKEFERPSWDTDMVAPIAKTAVGLEHMISGDSAIQLSTADPVASLSMRQKLYSYSLDSLVNINLPGYRTVKTLQNLELETDTVRYSVSLGQIARQLQEEGNPAGDYIISQHNSQSFVVSYSGISTGPFQISITDYLQEAQVKEGEVEITIENGLPVSLSNLELEVSNRSDGSLILSEQFPSIPSNTSQTSSQSLDGKTIEGNMNLDIANMDIGGGYVTIDTSDAVVATMVIKNISVESATAAFPDQNIIEERADTELEGMGETELTKAVLNSGALDINISTSARDTIFYTYRIPAAKKNGIPFEYSSFVPPAGASGVSTVSETFDFSGYEVDFTGEDNDTVNVVFNELTASIKSGTVVSLSLDDYIQADLEFSDIKPGYAEGYLGRDTIEVNPDPIPVSFFEGLDYDRLEFSSIDANLEIENYLGIDGYADIKELSASNSNSTVTLNNPVSGNIQAATRPGESGKSETTIPVNGTSPDPVELINIKPDYIGITGEAILNPGQNDNNHGDFASDDGGIDIYLNADLPLELLTENLQLTDTSDISFPASADKAIQEGSFSLLAENNFPVSAKVSLYFLKKGGLSVADSLSSATDIKAGVVTSSGGRVREREHSRITWELTEENIGKILKAEQVIFKVNFNSVPPGERVKIYSDYTIDLKLVGDFIYTVE